MAAMSNASMLQLTGDYYDGEDSRKTPVHLTLADTGHVMITDQLSGDVLFGVEQQQIGISARLGNSPRYLTLPDGRSIETLENDSVDRWVRERRPGLLTGLVHRLESNLTFVVLTVLGVVAMVWCTVQYGVPTASRAIANHLPANLLDRSSEESLYLLDQYWLQPSQLHTERQQQLRQHFAEAIDSHSGLNIRVDFRDSKSLGANAFALPNGQIIFTDAMVALAAHDDELLAILGHEIAHVKYRHSMRRVVQNSLTLFLMAMIASDLSGAPEVLLSLPVLFTELAYSRQHETEADRDALAFLKARNIPPSRFSDLMLRLDASKHTPKESDDHAPTSETTIKSKTAVKNASKNDSSTDIQWRRYLSTHPITQERVTLFQDEGK